MNKMLPPKMSIKEKAANAFDSTYRFELGVLNRAERRTVKGRLIEANARIKALEAMNKILLEEQPNE